MLTNNKFLKLCLSMAIHMHLSAISDIESKCVKTCIAVL